MLTSKLEFLEKNSKKVRKTEFRRQKTGGTREKADTAVNSTQYDIRDTQCDFLDRMYTDKI